MDISQLLELLKRVLLTPEVIGVTVAMLLFVSLVNFVVYYHKKPPAPTPKKVPVTPAEAGDGSGGKDAKKGGRSASKSPDDEDEEPEGEEADAKKKKGGKRAKKGAKEAGDEAEEE